MKSRLFTLLVFVFAVANLLDASSTHPKFHPSARKGKACRTNLASCPPEGCGGGDQLLNPKKNRTDAPTADYEVMTFADFLHLEEERPTQWTQNQNRDEVEQLGEDTPVTLAGYMISAHAGSPETCNCKLSGEENNDYHVNIAEHPKDPLTDSVVVEMTPRIRANIPEWTLTNLNNLMGSGPPLVRVSGYLLFDSEHVSRSGGERATIWEIHPVTKFEVCNATTCDVSSDSGWKDIHK